MICQSVHARFWRIVLKEALLSGMEIVGAISSGADFEAGHLIMRFRLRHRDQFSHPPEVLGDCCEVELATGAVRPSQSQSIELQDVFEWVNSWLGERRHQHLFSRISAGFATKPSNSHHGIYGRLEDDSRLGFDLTLASSRSSLRFGPVTTRPGQCKGSQNWSRDRGDISATRGRHADYPSRAVWRPATSKNIIY